MNKVDLRPRIERGVGCANVILDMGGDSSKVAREWVGVVVVFPKRIYLKNVFVTPDFLDFLL